MSILEIVIVFAIFFLFFLVVLGAFFHYQFISILRNKYKKTWEELGSPTLITNNSIRNIIRIMIFLKEKHYIDLNDEELNFRSRRLYIFNNLFFVFALICIASILAIIIYQ